MLQNVLFRAYRVGGRDDLHVRPESCVIAHSNRRTVENGAAGAEIDPVSHMKMATVVNERWWRNDTGPCDAAAQRAQPGNPFFDIFGWDCIQNGLLGRAFRLDCKAFRVGDVVRQAGQQFRTMPHFIRGIRPPSRLPKDNEGRANLSCVMQAIPELA